MTFDEYIIKFPLNSFNYSGIGNINTNLQYQQLENYLIDQCGLDWDEYQKKYPNIYSRFIHTYNTMHIEQWNEQIQQLKNQIECETKKINSIKKIIILNTKPNSVYWVDDTFNYPILMNLRNSLFNLVYRKNYLVNKVNYKLNNMETTHV